MSDVTSGVESPRGARNVGVRAAPGAAVLFGASAPLAKLLLGEVSPWLLAGLLYLGAGLGMGVWRRVRRAPKVRLARREVPWLVGAVAAGGVAGPVLLMFGLASMPASGASLLLNAEGVLTAVIAWVVFREPTDRRVMLGMLAIVAGAVVIAVPTGQAQVAGVWPTLAILGACACWALDNNLTRKVSLTDATWLAMVKGAIAGPTNLVVALVVLGAQLPSASTTAAAMTLGFVSYGLSLVLFIVGLRHVGTARAGAYFSIAPFFGAALALALGDTLTWQLVLAGALMAVGTWLHLSEDHGHEHTHDSATHEHWHNHDDGHHDHAHAEPVAPGVAHRHLHTHEVVTHTHDHYPDAHHRHRHTT